MRAKECTKKRDARAKLLFWLLNLLLSWRPRCRRRRRILRSLSTVGWIQKHCWRRSLLSYLNEPWRLRIPLIIFRFTRFEKNNISVVVSDLQGRKILGILNWKENWVKKLLLSKISHGGNSLQIEWNIKITPQTIRPRPQVSGYFWIRNFFFPDSKISTSARVRI